MKRSVSNIMYQIRTIRPEPIHLHLNIILAITVAANICSDVLFERLCALITRAVGIVCVKNFGCLACRILRPVIDYVVRHVVENSVVRCLLFSIEIRPKFAISGIFIPSFLRQ